MPTTVKWRVSRHYQAIEDENGRLLFSTKNGTSADEALAAAAPDLLTALERAIEALEKAFTYVPAGHGDAACRGNLVPTLQNARGAVRAARPPVAGPT